jgi:hypothetical protein
MMDAENLTCGFVPSKDWMPSILEQYRIADFLDWKREKRLELNPEFQRGDVWSPAAKTFLIDTILRKLPIPKVYLRTRVDVTTQKSVREVVDGQQRLRAILDFADDKFALSKRASEFAGKKYSTLTENEQEDFLGYAIAVDQLMNASTVDVLEVFARLNSYTVVLNPPEKRHGRYQGEFKYAIRNASRFWADLWEKFGVLSVKDRVRMMDDSLTAEMVGVLLEGVKDGGQPKIDILYKTYNNSFDVQHIANLNKVLTVIKSDFAPFMLGTPLLSPPHLLMLFSALAHVLIGIPDGDLKDGEMPARLPLSSNLDQARENLLFLGSLITDEDEPSDPYKEFWKASKSSTQRIASRRIRFPEVSKAIT